MFLNKRVPHGAGLGGGSGNAATALWAANELSGKPATPADLMEWAGEIGSDISVFFGSGASYCMGRGEVVEDVIPPPVPTSLPLLLVKPPQGLSTPAVFKALRLNACSTVDPRQLLAELQEQQTVTDNLCVNDLQRPAFELYVENSKKSRFAGKFVAWKPNNSPLPSLLFIHDRMVFVNCMTFSPRTCCQP